MKPLILKVDQRIRVRVFPHALQGYTDTEVTVGDKTFMGTALVYMDGKIRQVLDTPEQIDAQLDALDGDGYPAVVRTPRRKAAP